MNFLQKIKTQWIGKFVLKFSKTNQIRPLICRNSQLVLEFVKCQSISSLRQVGSLTVLAWAVNHSRGVAYHKPNIQELIWPKVKKIPRTNLIEIQKSIVFFMAVIQQIFLPQFYKLETIIFKSLIYNPKFLPLINNSFFPNSKNFRP